MCLLAHRYADASYYFYQLAMEALKEITHAPSDMTNDDRRLLERFSELYDKVCALRPRSERARARAPGQALIARMHALQGRPCPAITALQLGWQ
jgi:hypothetical protein